MTTSRAAVPASRPASPYGSLRTVRGPLSAFLWLRGCAGTSRNESRQSLDQGIGAERAKGVVKGAEILLGADVDSALHEYRPGIQARVHPHDRDAGSSVAGKQRPLNRRRATPTGQQRRMNVDGTMRRRLEEALRE